MNNAERLLSEAVVGGDERLYPPETVVEQGVNVVPQFGYDGETVEAIEALELDWRHHCEPGDRFEVQVDGLLQNRLRPLGHLPTYVDENGKPHRWGDVQTTTEQIRESMRVISQNKPVARPMQ